MCDIYWTGGGGDLIFLTRLASDGPKRQTARERIFIHRASELNLNSL